MIISYSYGSANREIRLYQGTDMRPGKIPGNTTTTHLKGALMELAVVLSVRLDLPISLTL